METSITHPLILVAVGAPVIACIAAITTPTRAQFKEGDWERLD